MRPVVSKAVRLRECWLREIPLYGENMNPEILNVEVLLLYLLSKYPGIRETPNVVVVIEYVRQEFLPVI